jgi:hypothetical protein
VSASSAALLKSQADRSKAQSLVARIAPTSSFSAKPPLQAASNFSATSILLPVMAPTLTASQEQQIKEYEDE